MKIKSGDMAVVIDSIDRQSVGMIVEVVSYRGEHSKLGPIWRCASKQTIVSEYGGVGHQADFAESWLRKIANPELIFDQRKGKALHE